jgi:UDP-N-acetylglucosamine--N-acetylmuramyl-(pentapeptide) pyrophosphoryl-undecaprenol N-acetylglucosamine transferase
VLNENTKKFKGDVIWLGNPVREEILKGDKERAKKIFNIKSDLPVVFVLGGGTGSQRVNELIADAVPELKDVCEIIHVTGQERKKITPKIDDGFFPHYHCFEFFVDEMPEAYAIADVVIARGGFGTISEIASMGKPAIFIPKPGHQCQNVAFLVEHEAGISVDERVANGRLLAEMIKDLIKDTEQRKKIGKNLYTLIPPADEDEIADIIDKLTFKI